MVAAVASATPAVQPVADDGLHYVCAAIVGTFYRGPEPGAAPFVSEGDMVRPGQQIAILEAMKMMMPVEADRAVAGRRLGGRGKCVRY